MRDKRKRNLTEKAYIFKRTIQAFAHSLAYQACRIFPVDERKVVMWTFEGNGGYGCSPKYVAEELLERNRKTDTDYRIIWLVNDTHKEFPEEITKVKSTLWSRAYHLSTAGTWLSNTRTFYGTKKGKGSATSRHGMQQSASSQLGYTAEHCFLKWRVLSVHMIPG